MSKDLEKEYRALMDSEAPDLWARIESGLEEKETTAVLHQRNIVGKKRHMKAWAGLAAACACVVLSIPVMKSRLSLGGTKSFTAAPGQDTTAYMECAPEAAALTAAEGAGADETVLEESVSPAAMNDNNDRVEKEAGAALSGSVDNRANIDLNAAVLGSACDGMNPSVSDDAEADLNALASDKTDSQSDLGIVQETGSFAVTAEILDINVCRDGGILYIAKVVVSEDAAMQAGSEIKIFSSALAEEDVISLEKSQTYELTLIDDVSQSEEDTPVYTLQAVKRLLFTSFE